MTVPEPLQQVDRTFVNFRGHKFSYFSGCDYFRLSSHPLVVEALREGARKFGISVSASRLTTGNHKLYQQLEAKLAGFFGAEAALLTSGGYLTNLTAAQALAGEFSHVLIDERAHPSVSDASRFVEAPVLTFRHRDSRDLERAVRRCGPGAKLLLMTDGMFSHDGSAAPLDEYFQVLPKDAWVFVDDAHGAGVLGETGKGAPELAGVARRRIIQTITLSKAFGAYGGAILSSRSFREKVIDRSRAFIGNTPLPLPLANAALRAVDILLKDKSLRKRLWANADTVKETALKLRLNLSTDCVMTPGPILRLAPESESQARAVHRALRAAKIFPPFTQYPGSGSGAFRFVISSEHTSGQIENLLGALSTAARSF